MLFSMNLIIFKRQFSQLITGNALRISYDKHIYVMKGEIKTAMTGDSIDIITSVPSSSKDVHCNENIRVIFFLMVETRHDYWDLI